MNVFTAPVHALFPPPEPVPTGDPGALPPDEPEDPFGGAIRSFLRVSLASCLLILAVGAFFVAARSAGTRVLALLGMDLRSEAFGAMLIALALIFYLFIGRTIVTATKE